MSTTIHRCWHLFLMLLMSSIAQAASPTPVKAFNRELFWALEDRRIAADRSNESWSLRRIVFGYLFLEEESPVAGLKILAPRFKFEAPIVESDWIRVWLEALSPQVALDDPGLFKAAAMLRPTRFVFPDWNDHPQLELIVSSVLNLTELASNDRAIAQRIPNGNTFETWWRINFLESLAQRNTKLSPTIQKSVQNIAATPSADHPWDLRLAAWRALTGKDYHVLPDAELASKTLVEIGFVLSGFRNKSYFGKPETEMMELLHHLLNAGRDPLLSQHPRYRGVLAHLLLNSMNLGCAETIGDSLRHKTWGRLRLPKSSDEAAVWDDRGFPTQHGVAVLTDVQSNARAAVAQLRVGGCAGAIKKVVD